MTRALTAMMLLAVILGCAHTPLPPPRDGEGQAVWIAWRFYGRTDQPPKIRWKRGTDLDCLQPNGAPGFTIADVGDGPDMPVIARCVGGLTLSTLEVILADYGEDFHDSSLAHELYHVCLLRELIIDAEHKRAEWQPGGLVDQANEKLIAAGL